MLDKYGTAYVMPKKQEAGHLTHDCKFPSQVSWSQSSSSGAGRLAIKASWLGSFCLGPDLLPRFNRALNRFRLYLRKVWAPQPHFNKTVLILDHLANTNIRRPHGEQDLQRSAHDAKLLIRALRHPRLQRDTAS
jgi:hypothetical protein